jgi:hypothetical protein
MGSVYAAKCYQELKAKIFMKMAKNINSNFPRNNNPRFHLSFVPFILV